MIKAQERPRSKRRGGLNDAKKKEASTPRQRGRWWSQSKGGSHSPAQRASLVRKQRRPLRQGGAASAVPKRRRPAGSCDLGLEDAKARKLGASALWEQQGHLHKGVAAFVDLESLRLPSHGRRGLFRFRTTGALAMLMQGLTTLQDHQGSLQKCVGALMAPGRPLLYIHRGPCRMDTGSLFFGFVRTLPSVQRGFADPNTKAPPASTWRGLSGPKAKQTSAPMRGDNLTAK